MTRGFPRWPRALAGASTAVAAAALLTRAALVATPYPELDAFLARPYSLRVVDRAGRELYVGTVGDGVRRQYAALGELPPWLPGLFLEAEDSRFYLHPGVDPVAVIRSALQAAASGQAVSGASTVSMQLARLARPRDRSLRSKALEALDAMRLEARIGKRRALELYLSSIPYGRGAEGVASAARAYFGKDAAQLDAYEAAVLATLPRSPGRLDPAEDPDGLAAAVARGFGRSKARRDDPEAFDALVRAAVAGSRAGSYPTVAPHFVRDVVLPVAEEARGDGWTVRTTLDLELQGRLERAVAYELEGLDDARLRNGAGIVLDPRNGDILAWSGSVDFDDPAGGQLDGVLARNQPGSCLKPFLYALALDSGFKPSDPLPDVPMDFGGERVYVPLNFNNKYNGPVRLRVALASSLNVPAVYTLNRLGVQRFADFLVSLGFESVAGQRDHLGVGLALGNAEVSLRELATAFAVFLRDGVALVARGTLPAGAAPDDGGVETSGPPECPAAGEPVMSPYAAETIRSILSDPASRFLGFGEGPAFDVGYQAMFKTGTANQYQHVWALGATADLVVGVWMGNFEGFTVIGSSGSSVPARAVVGVLDAATEPGSALPAPSHGHEERICSLSGGIAGPGCPGAVYEWFRDGESPAPCDWHDSGAPGSEPRYPPEYRAWLDGGLRAGRLQDGGSVGIGAAILKPRDGAGFWLDPSLPPDDQRIPVELLFRSADGLYVEYDGRVMLPDPAGRLSLPAESGEHVLTLYGDGAAVDSIRFTVD